MTTHFAAFFPTFALVLLPACALVSASYSNSFAIWPCLGHNSTRNGVSPFVGAQNGTLQWNFTSGDTITASPVIGSDGTVFVGSGDSTFYGLNGTTGAVKIKFAAQNSIVAAAAISARGVVVFGSQDSNVYALDAEGGTQLWKFATSDVVESAVLVDDADLGTVYVGSNDGNLYAIDLHTGLKKWAFATQAAVSSSPAMSWDGSTVYVGSRDNSLYAVSSTLGVKQWAFATGGSVNSNPVVGFDGVIFVGSEVPACPLVIPPVGPSVPPCDLLTCRMVCTRRTTACTHCTPTARRSGRLLLRITSRAAPRCRRMARRCSSAPTTTTCTRLMLQPAPSWECSARAARYSRRPRLAQMASCTSAPVRCTWVLAALVPPAECLLRFKLLEFHGQSWCFKCGLQVCNVTGFSRACDGDGL